MTAISLVVMMKKNMSSKKPLEVGKLYQTKISISFYKFSSPTSVELLKTINSKTIIMVLENQCQSGLFRFIRIITGDGEVGYIDSYYHYEDGETMKKIV